jgi:hypothetical protein
MLLPSMPLRHQLVPLPATLLPPCFHPSATPMPPPAATPLWAQYLNTASPLSSCHPNSIPKLLPCCLPTATGLPPYCTVQPPCCHTTASMLPTMPNCCPHNILTFCQFIIVILYFLLLPCSPPPPYCDPTFVPTYCPTALLPCCPAAPSRCRPTVPPLLP